MANGSSHQYSGNQYIYWRVVVTESSTANTSSNRYVNASIQAMKSSSSTSSTSRAGYMFFTINGTTYRYPDSGTTTITLSANSTWVTFKTVSNIAIPIGTNSLAVSSAFKLSDVSSASTGSDTFSLSNLVYTVTFINGFGTTLKTESVAKGYNATPPSNPTHTGYTFAGWSGTYTNVTSSRTIVATWNANTYTISYNANGGEGAPSSQTKTHDKTLVLSTTIPTRSGYVFLGWATSSSDTTATYSAGGTFTANANITLYAVWVSNVYIITYNANKGQGEPASQSKTAGVALTLSSTKPTRNRHTFLGWSTSKTATTATYSASGSFTTDANTTLYAVWRLDDDSIRMYRDGVLEAIKFKEVDTVAKHFEKGGIVYATKFLNHDLATVKILKDGTIYAKLFREC